MKPIPNSIASMAEELAAWRQDIHAHPELCYEETRTAGIVAEKLKEFGFDAIETGVGKTGVVGILHGADGPATRKEDRILVRADMDALPIEEATGAPYASTVPGKMHACGHDGHTTMLLGAAKHLAATRNFSGTVVFCFQPAEEGGAGAQAMIDDGMLERHPVRAVYGMHNDPSRPAGEFGVRPGPVLAYADRFRIRIEGKGGHAAQPHDTHDPIIAGAALVNGFQTIVSRRRDPMKPAVISVTKFEAGSTYNVIPQTAEIWGTVRTFDDDVSALIIAEMEKQCRLVGEAYGVTVDAELGADAYPVCANDPEQAAFALKVMTEVVGEENVDADVEPVLGGEDFAFLARAEPGAFVVIGNGKGAPLHHPQYNFNDEVAPIGVAYWAKLAETALPRAG